jgi:hypothetical protein
MSKTWKFKQGLINLPIRFTEIKKAAAVCEDVGNGLHMHCCVWKCTQMFAMVLTIKPTAEATDRNSLTYSSLLTMPTHI